MKWLLIYSNGFERFTEGTFSSQKDAEDALQEVVDNIPDAYTEDGGINSGYYLSTVDPEGYEPELQESPITTLLKKLG